MKHTSLSPKVSKPTTVPTEISPTTGAGGHRKYHSGLNKAESRREDEILDNSPVIVPPVGGSKTAGKKK